jgi:hypothetical protein
MQIRSHLARRLAVGAAVVAALSMAPLALTGQAGAATTTAPSTSHAKSTNHAKSSVPAVCSGGKSHRYKLRRQGKGFEKKALKLEAREAKAKAAGHTKRAAYLAKLAATYESNGTRMGKRYAKMESRKSAYMAKVCAGH